MKVTVLTPVRLKPGKAPEKVGAVVELDDEEAQELAAVGAVELPRKAEKGEKPAS